MDLQLGDMGWPARIALFISVAPLFLAVVYAIWPTPHRLALMRPLSLAALFAGLTSTTFGCATLLLTIGRQPELAQDDWQWIAVGLSERLISLIVPFACLAAAWLLVAIGMRRGIEER